MNRIEQAQVDAETLWARLPKNYQEKVKKQAERLHRFLAKVRDTVEEDGDWEWVEDSVE